MDQVGTLPSFVTTITQEDQVLNYYLQASEVHEAGHQQTAVPKLIPTRPLLQEHLRDDHRAYLARRPIVDVC